MSGRKTGPDPLVFVYFMKLKMRTIDSDKNMSEHILSPREGFIMFNVATLLACKALLLSFPDN